MKVISSVDTREEDINRTTKNEMSYSDSEEQEREYDRKLREYELEKYCKKSDEIDGKIKMINEKKPKKVELMNNKRKIQINGEMDIEIIKLLLKKDYKIIEME